jgi:hypothetical protein
MRCIFCKESSESSVSEEHIMPESLGNTDHVLPPGWVCDSCNNYLSRKVEAPFLNSMYGRVARFEMAVPSKKGVIPRVGGILLGSLIPIQAFRDDHKNICISARDDKDQDSFHKTLKSQKRGTFIFPAAVISENTYEISRFIGMISLEVLAYRCMDVTGWNDEIVDKPELDDLRNYVRRGKRNFIWPLSIRKIYSADNQFFENRYGHFEVLHEWTILFLPSKENPLSGEYYVVVAIFGVEYAINLSSPDIESYQKWLENNCDASPLYPNDAEKTG